MGATASTTRVKIHYARDATTVIQIAYEYLSYLERMSDRKRIEVAIPIQIEQPFLDMAQGTLAWLVTCPTCNGLVIVARQDINCSVFRHGVFKDKSGQIPSHATKEQVDAMLEAKAVWGCGQPFYVDRAHGCILPCDWEYAGGSTDACLYLTPQTNSNVNKVS